jgi:hypothetical protein
MIEKAPSASVFCFPSKRYDSRQSFEPCGESSRCSPLRSLRFAGRQEKSPENLAFLGCSKKLLCLLKR